MNRIVTFYSYKGGVGRTLALANIGVLLAMRGKRVLLMDWDLEAPGLDRYFSSYLPNGFASDRGTIQLLYEARTNANADWHPHVQQITVQADDASTPATYTLSVIPSGVGSPDYARKVQTFSWANFLRKKDGGPIIERWQFQPAQILELTKIPYVTRFSFGEPLVVLTHSLTDPKLPGFYLEIVARLLATDFKDASHIIDPGASKSPDIFDEMRLLVERTPIDEVELNQRLRTAENEHGEGPTLASLLNVIGLALSERAPFTSAEPLYRRALVIFEKAFGPEHPKVAIRLHNLARLLQATNRPVEAEPLMKCSLVIFLKFSHETGHLHPHLRDAFNNYFALLKEISLGDEEIAERLAQVRIDTGFDRQEYGKLLKQVGLEER